MWRDRWLTLGAWADHLNIVVLPGLAAFIALVIYCHRIACRRAP